MEIRNPSRPVHEYLKLPIAKLPTHTLIDLPILSDLPKEKGPVVLIKRCDSRQHEINGW